MMESSGAEQRGSTCINRTKVPVYRLVSGEEVVEQADKVTGLPEVVSVAGARRFKAQRYAFHPDVESVVAGGVRSRPLPLQTEEEQLAYGEAVLRAFFTRVLDSGAAFKFHAEAR